MKPAIAQRYVGVLLAAGTGSRFDPSGRQNKLLQLTREGTEVVVAAARNLVSVLPDTIAIVRNVNDDIAILLRKAGCAVHACPEAEQGLSASLKCALRHTADASGWIIALGDMPFVRPDTIAGLLDALAKGADIAVPVSAGVPGNPVGFSRTHLPALLQLRGDRGARTIVQSHECANVAVFDDGIFHDIDTPADLDNC